MPDPSAEYPEYPGEALTEGAPAPPAPRAATQPSSIATAVKLMWAGAALELVARALGLATGAYIGDDAPAQASGGLAGVVVSGIVLFGLWALMAQTNGKGYPGARVAATILGVIGIIRGLGGFFVIGAFGGGFVGLVCSMILVGLAITILVLLWTKESSAFYIREVSDRG